MEYSPIRRNGPEIKTRPTTEESEGLLFSLAESIKQKWFVREKITKEESPQEEFYLIDESEVPPVIEFDRPIEQYVHEQNLFFE